MSEKLETYRARIDALDREIVGLLNERAKVVVDVGKLKSTDGTAIYAPDREKQVFARLAQANTGPLPDKCLRAIWREMMSGSFALEKPLKISYLGPKGSFSHLAVRRQFGACVEYVPTHEIATTFRQVARGETDMGLVPIENSFSGGVTETLDALIAEEVTIRSEILEAIHHHLMARGPLDKIKRIYSKPEIFSQCRLWLAANMPHAKLVEEASSSRSAELAAEEPDAAAIASALAAEIYRMNVLAENIEDSAENITRFLVIGRQGVGRTGDDKTAIFFTTTHHAGALAEVLDVIRDNEINLTHIDKRPSRRINWEYYFFVEAEGHLEDKSMAAALEQIKKHCLHLKILGSFPRAMEVLG